MNKNKCSFKNIIFFPNNNNKNETKDKTNRYKKKQTRKHAYKNYNNK